MLCCSQLLGHHVGLEEQGLLPCTYDLQVLAEASDIDAVWKELADIQQSALDAALAAKAKRKPKPAAAASSMAQDTQAAATSQGHSSFTDQPNHADSNGHLASEENLAANRQGPVPNAQASSFSKSQVCSCYASMVLLHKITALSAQIWQMLSYGTKFHCIVNAAHVCPAV